MPEPIFILGVPRSGTTLLRAILDSHPYIACGPETPWLGAHQPRSVAALYRFLLDSPQGYVAAFRMDAGVVRDATRAFVDSLLLAYARSKGKPRWAEKTPDNALHLPTLLDLFPDARCIHLVRDPLDVALSTVRIPDHRRGLSPRLEASMCVGEGCSTTPTLTGAVLRWTHWNRLIARDAPNALRVRYASLVREPEHEVRRILDFLGEPFDPGVLDFSRRPHDFLPADWGGSDLARHARIVTDRLDRAARELDAPTRAFLASLAQWEHAAPFEPIPRDDALLRFAADEIALWAERLGLDPALAEPAARAWIEVFSQHNWAGASVLTAVPSHPLPWMLAILGADLACVPDLPPASERLARRLRVRARAVRSPAEATGAHAAIGLAGKFPGALTV